MEKIPLTSSQIIKILKDKKKRERELNIKISGGKNFIQIEGAPLDEYTALQVIHALSLNFDVNTSLLLKDSDYMLQTIQIKDFIKKKPRRLSQVKARIIGRQGKVLKNISQLSGCAIKLHNNSITILGKTNNVEIAASALLSLIRGSKHSNVFSRLEKAEHEEGDLGLKLDVKK